MIFNFYKYHTRNTMGEIREEVSNYEKVYEHFRKLFLGLNHEKIAQKLRLALDEDRIYVPYFHQEYVIDRKTGDITRGFDRSKVNVNDRLLMMHHLYFYKEDAYESEEMIPFREIKGVSHFESAHNQMTALPLAKAFQGKRELFLQRAEELGGKIEKFGDASVTFQAFPTILLTYIFWDADEEFSASVNILFEKNITQFIHPESVPGLAEAGAKLLMRMPE